MDQTLGYVNSIGDIIMASLQAAVYRVFQFLPELISAIVILIIGWIIAKMVGALVRKVVQVTGADAAIERAGINEKLMVGGKYKLLSGMLGQFVKWFILIVTFIAVANTLNLPELTQFLNSVALYIPRAIVAVIILIVGMLAADFLSGFISKGVEASKLPVRHKKTIVSVGRYAIIFFAVMAALTQLNIVPELIQILFGGMVLALALAFGLGGREEAARFLANFRQEK